MNLGIALFFISSFSASNSINQEPAFWNDVFPILQKRCIICHALKNVTKPDIGGGLQLESLESIRERSLIQPGDSAKSKLFQVLVTKDEETRMPLDASPLPKQDIETIARWIDQGAIEGVRTTPSPPARARPKLNLAKSNLAFSSFAPNQETAKLLGIEPSAECSFELPVAPLPPTAALEFSPDGSLLAIGSNRLITIWNVATASVAATIPTDCSIHAFRFRQDGTRLAAAGGLPAQHGTIIILNCDDWSVATTLKVQNDSIYGVSFHPTEPQIASASLDSTVALSDLQSGKLIRLFKHHTEAVFDVDFTRDGKFLVSASRDRSVKIVATADWNSIQTVSGHEESVTNLLTTPDSVYVFSAGKEADILWSTIADGENYSLFSGHSGQVLDIALRADGTKLASTGSDQTVRIFGTDFGEDLQTVELPVACTSIAIHPSKPLVVAGGRNGVVYFLNTVSGATIGQLVSLWNPEGESSWLAISGHGYFNGSRELADQLRLAIRDQRSQLPESAKPIHSPEQTRIEFLPKTESEVE